MDAKKIEIRTLDCKLSVREAAPDAQGESRTITGTAIVFDAESEVLTIRGYSFHEVIKPSRGMYDGVSELAGHQDEHAPRPRPDLGALQQGHRLAPTERGREGCQLRVRGTKV